MRVQLENGAYEPLKAHTADAGFDLRSPVSVVVPSGGSAIIDTGVRFEIPVGYVGMLKSKSGLNVKHDITSEGVIDAGYTGTVVVKLYNHGTHDYVVRQGDKITQLVVMPILVSSRVELVDKIDGLDRGDNGFGSTGR